MPEPTLTFKCLGHTKLDDNLISHYHLQVTSTQSGRVETISVSPNHLASTRSMKRLLLGRCMFYSVTQKKHAEMLIAMFDAQDAEAESQCLD